MKNKPVENEPAEVKVAENVEETVSVKDGSASTLRDDSIDNVDRDTENIDDARDDERKELISHLQRLQAEFDNYRKRMMKEQEDMKQSSNDSILKELIPIIDNLDLAISHYVSGAAKDGDDEFHVGITMIRRQLDQLLSKFGVEKMDATGTFNPTMHEALMTESCEGMKKGAIVTIIRDGYVRAGRVLRPAKVSVAK